MAKRKTGSRQGKRSLRVKDLAVRGEAAKRLKGGMVPCVRVKLRPGIVAQDGG